MSRTCARRRTGTQAGGRVRASERMAIAAITALTFIGAGVQGCSDDALRGDAATDGTDTASGSASSTSSTNAGSSGVSTAASTTAGTSDGASESDTVGTGTQTSDASTASTASTAATDTAATDTAATGTSDGPPPVCTTRDDCELPVLRLATFNVEGIGAEGSAEYGALVDVLRRLDPDVACVQEVGSSETAQLAALALAVDLPETALAPAQDLGGPLTVACLARRPIREVTVWRASELSGDPSANDLGRLLLAVRVELAPGVAIGVHTLHLKAGSTPADLLRREVEARRMQQAVAAYQLEHPDDVVAVVGDVNEELEGGAPNGTTLSTLPTGLPQSYVLGSDIGFPLVYDPFLALLADGRVAVAAGAEDSPFTQGTRPESGRRIDYILTGPRLRRLDAEVYDSCYDDDIDQGVPGERLVKSGSPLACGRSREASDHAAVAADLAVEPTAGG